MKQSRMELERKETDLTSPSSVSASLDSSRRRGVVGGSAAAEEEVEEESTQRHLPWFFPHFRGRPLLYGNPEALGWCLAITAQTVAFLGVGTFIAPALVYFARLEAGCATEPPEGQDNLPECNNKVFGIIKPSSLITTATSIVSVVVALSIPWMGAVVDFTNNRRLLGRILCVVYFCLMAPQLALSEKTWFPILVLLLLMGCVAFMLTLVLHAYLPELTDDEEKLNHLTKTFVITPASSIILFVILVIGTSTALGTSKSDQANSRIASGYGLAVLGICYGLAWYRLLERRPAVHTLQEGQSLVSAGFVQISHTLKRLYHHNRTLLWFYVTIAFADVKPLTGIALTFLNEQQQFTSTDIGMASVIMLISTIPGAVLSSYTCRKLNPIWSSMLAIFFMILNTILAAVCLTGGTGQKGSTFGFVVGWGITGGWKVTSTQMLVAAIVPEGQDAELMGFYLFADACLSWFPPLIFTSLNEAGYSQRIGLCSINIFFAIGLLAHFQVGNYNDAVKRAERVALPSPPVLSSTSRETTEEEPKRVGTEDDEEGILCTSPREPREGRAIGFSTSHTSACTVQAGVPYVDSNHP